MTAETVGAQLRRRRIAAYRCEPLEDGRYDTYDPPVQRRARRRRKTTPRVQVDIVTAFTAEVRGAGVYRTLELLAIPKQYTYRPPSGGSACWLIPARHARDVEAAAEHLGGSAQIDGQGVLL